MIKFLTKEKKLDESPQQFSPLLSIQAWLEATPADLRCARKDLLDKMTKLDRATQPV
jgi:hypothetical protein